MPRPLGPRACTPSPGRGGRGPWHRGGAWGPCYRAPGTAVGLVPRSPARPDGPGGLGILLAGAFLPPPCVVPLPLPGAWGVGRARTMPVPGATTPVLRARGPCVGPVLRACGLCVAHRGGAGRRSARRTRAGRVEQAGAGRRTAERRATRASRDRPGTRAGRATRRGRGRSTRPPFGGHGTRHGARTRSGRGSFVIGTPMRSRLARTVPSGAMRPRRHQAASGESGQGKRRLGPCRAEGCAASSVAGRDASGTV